MSVYSHGDKDRGKDPKVEPKKEDLIAEASKALDGFGKSISGLFTSKDKKWAKKGGGHALGSSSASAPPPPPSAAPQAPMRANLPAPPRAMTPAAEAAAAREAALARQRAGSARPGSAAPRAAAPVDRVAQTGAAPASQRNFGGGAVGSGAAPAATVAVRAPVDEASVALCVEMGFEARSAREALAARDGSVEAAIELLASGFTATAVTPPQTTTRQQQQEVRPTPD